MPRYDKKASTIVMARVPQDLVEQVKHYTTSNHVSLSQVIRVGLEMCLHHDVPRHANASRNDQHRAVIHASIPDVRPPLPSATTQSKAEGGRRKDESARDVPIQPSAFIPQPSPMRLALRSLANLLLTLVAHREE